MRGNFLCDLVLSMKLLKEPTSDEKYDNYQIYAIHE